MTDDDKIELFNHKIEMEHHILDAAQMRINQLEWSIQAIEDKNDELRRRYEND